MNIFVANLDFRLSEELLEETFKNYGEVTSVRIIKDRDSGRSKGFGFVEMANDDDGAKAIEALNDYELEGRNMVVKVANERVER